jgi:hypothetical protein
MGCGSLKKQSMDTLPPANSLVKCSPVAKDGKYKTFGEIYSKLVEVIHQNNDCAGKHNSLVDYVEATHGDSQ